MPTIVLNCLIFLIGLLAEVETYLPSIDDTRLMHMKGLERAVARGKRVAGLLMWLYACRFQTLLFTLSSNAVSIYHISAPLRTAS